MVALATIPAPLIVDGFIAIVAAALGIAQPAQAEVRVPHEMGGSYAVEVMSWWQIPFRSVVPQGFDFSCGSAAVATLLTYHYKRPTPEKLAFQKMWETGNREMIRKVGFSMFDMKSYLDSLGYRAEGFRLPIDRLGQLKRPAIVLLDLKGFKHFVVVKGVHDGRVLIGDPMLGLQQYAAKDFAKIWNGIALAIVDDPSDMQVAYNLAGDWGPWSEAPMKEGGISIAASHLTSNLPPIYQVTPHFLIDVRVGTVR